MVGRTTGNDVDVTNPSKDEENEKMLTSSGHIMISYQWDCQELMLKIKRKLEAEGYRTWMDLDEMGGSTLQKMAEAVENASVMLLTISRKYKNSVNCRTEAEYAYKLGTSVVPLKIEDGYDPDGWLDNPQRLIRHEHSLKLVNLAQSDTAVYQCLVKNDHGSLIEQGYLNVLTWKPEARPKNVHKVYSQVKGKNITLKCPVFGSPVPTITWLKGSDEIEATDRIYKSNHLQISKARRGDEGPYSCLARNQFGTFMMNFTVNVLKPTNLKIGNAMRKTAKGNPVTLIAKVNADPDNHQVGEVQWTRNGVPLGSGAIFRIAEADFNDAGKYKAEVTTKYDRDHKYVALIITDRPSPPQDFSFDVDQADPLRVIFNWLPGKDFHSPIEEYKIEFEEDDFDPGLWQPVLDSISGGERTVAVDLSPGVNYKFRGFARNAVGWSYNSSTVTRRYRTPDGYPHLAYSWSAIGTAPKTISVSWEPVKGINQNGPGFGYQIRYKPAETGDWTVLNISASETSYEFKGSKTYAPYLVQLTTFNEVGMAQEKAQIIQCNTGEDVPIESPSILEVDVEVNRPTKVTVRWRPISEESVRGQLLGYTIMVTTEGVTKERIVTISGNANRAEIDNLLPDTEYHFRIAAFNGAGNGSFSDGLTRATPRGAPEPGNINVTLDDEVAIIAWQAPNAGIPADQVALQFKKSGSQSWQESSKQTANKSNVTFTFPVNPSEDYSFRVMSYNNYGSTASEEFTSADDQDSVATAGNFTKTIWFIVIMSLVGLAILIILIICFVRRNSKGRKYSVSDKEHRFVESQPINREDSGEYNDEVDDVKKPLSTFGPASSSNGNKNGAPLRSRDDSIGGDSIGALVGADTKEFNEDGSFIGQYGVIHSPSSNETPTTPPSDEYNVVNNPNGDAV